MDIFKHIVQEENACLWFKFQWNLLKAADYYMDQWYTIPIYQRIFFSTPQSIKLDDIKGSRP